jgi:pimeloyl-ACP methyl ester carboxylesterase
MGFVRAPRGTRRYWINLAVFTLAAAVAGYFAYAYFGVSYFMARGFTYPQRLSVCCSTPADMGYPYEDVSFVTRDGVTIRGWWIPSQNRAAVIVLHPMASNRLGALDHARLLAQHGFGSLLIDLRAHGESGGERLTFGGSEYLDVSGAVDYLQARTEVESGRIGVLGLSLGANFAILGAAHDDRIAAIVADAPGATVFRDWPRPVSVSDAIYVPFDLMFFFYLRRLGGVAEPVSIRGAVSKLAPRPIFLVGGDTPGSTREQRSITQFFAAASDPKEMWIIPNTQHIAGLQTRPDEYEARVTGFFDHYLAPSQP